MIIIPPTIEDLRFMAAKNWVFALVAMILSFAAATIILSALLYTKINLPAFGYGLIFVYGGFGIFCGWRFQHWLRYWLHLRRQ